jgi:hypothetical protein
MFTRGRVVLGIYPDRTKGSPPYSVSFANVEIRSFAL